MSLHNKLLHWKIKTYHSVNGIPLISIKYVFCRYDMYTRKMHCDTINGGSESLCVNELHKWTFCHFDRLLYSCAITETESVSCTFLLDPFVFFVILYMYKDEIESLFWHVTNKRWDQRVKWTDFKLKDSFWSWSMTSLWKIMTSFLFNCEIYFLRNEVRDVRYDSRRVNKTCQLKLIAKRTFFFILLLNNNTKL